MTDKWLLEKIDREKAKQQWNELRKRRTKIRQLAKKYPTPQYQAKLELYKVLLQHSEIAKIVVQYLKGLLIVKEEVSGGQ